jgi:hypothetical protein
MTFLNKPEELLKNINKLPEDVTHIIQSYIPKIVSIFLTRKSYLENHVIVKKYINKRNIENYIRCMIRQDNDFVFNQLLKENHKRWINMKKCYYKNCIYSNYINFLESYAIDNESTKCRKTIVELFQELGLSKNQHKKNVSKYIRWKT